MVVRRPAKKLEIPVPIKIERLTEVLRINGVPVLVHWSVWVIVALILFNVIRNPLGSILALLAYLGMFLIHETGHLVAAEKMHCEVFWIRIYPICGITSFEIPWSKFDHCVIAWGGVIAQGIVFTPIVVAVALFGYTRFEPVNAVLAILGFFSLGTALFNLLPLRPLDGSIAWAIIPEAFKRLRDRRDRHRPSWR